jgi:predicted transcriptional regulator
MLQGLGLGVFGMVRRRKTRVHNLPKHPARRRIIEFVFRRPGARFTTICDDLEINRGTGAYHMRLLEDAGIVEGVSDRRRHHYFPPGLPDDLKQALLLLNRGRVLDIVLKVAEEPGIVQRDLLEQVDVTRGMLRQYLDDLQEAKLIRERAAARNKKYYATPQLVDLLQMLGNLR